MVPGAIASADPTTSTDPVIRSAQPEVRATAPDGSRFESLTVASGNRLMLHVYSAAMHATIPVDVQRPADAGAARPVLYLLNGGGGGEDSATWRVRTDAEAFLADKNVNVVSPIGGRWSYYADWKNVDPVLGNNKWTTFLTRELPPVVDAALGTNGVNAIAGLSSSATAVLQMAIAAPHLYRGVASYSGCAQTSDPIGQQFVKLTVETWGGGNTVNMWGPPDDPLWAANDPYVHADGLRGLDLYISNGNGLPGRYDTPDGPGIDGSSRVLAQQIAVGGVIEAATNYCTHRLAEKLAQLGIPATFNFRDSGTHSWGYWQDDLKYSWPILARSLGI
ncbi:alpha/beta hydrolase [Rhodococcus olei]